MNKRRSIFLKFLFVVLLVTPALKGVGQEELPLTINEALEVTYNNNPAIKQSHLLEKEREMQKKAARGLYFPQLSMKGSYQFMSDDIHLDLNPIKQAITPLYETLGQYGNFSDVPNPDPATQDQMPVLPEAQSTQAVRSQMMDAANMLKGQDWNRTIQQKQFGVVSARIKWPVFTGGKIAAANKASDLKHQESKQLSRESQAALTSELIRRYYGMRLAGAVVNIRSEVLQLMDQHYRDANRLFEEGMVAQAQMLHAQVYRAEAQRKLKKAESDYFVAGKALRNSLSVTDDRIINPVSKLFYLDSIAPANYFIQAALTSNPQLQQVVLKKQLAHQKYRVQRSDYLPTAAVAGMYDVYNKDLSPHVPDWMVGVNLQWSLFDGLARTNKVKAAKYQEDRVGEIEKKARQDIHTIIEKLYQQLKIDVEQIDELETSAAFAREYLKVSRRSFQEGMATSTDVTEASLALSKVQIEKLQVMYDYVTTLSKLLELTGQPETFKQYQHHENTVFENDLKLTENE